jgi:pyruvate ferredoxin oxidoreductase alpha subunit
VRQALASAKRVIVLEKSLAVGIGGIVSTNVRTALDRAIPVHTVIAGLGGRPITRVSLERIFGSEQLEQTTFLDLERPLVEKVLAREKELRRSGPRAESILREKHGLPAR